MSGENPWSKRYAFWKSMPTRSYVLFLTGVFFTFLPAGLLRDIARLGANSPARLAASAMLAGSIAVTYVLVVHWRPRFLPLLVALHITLGIESDRLFGAAGPPLSGQLLKARLLADVNGATLAIIVGFVLLTHVIRGEGARYGRMQAEIALARDIHRHLVPRIVRTIGRYEFRGVSLPSGDVGGDLVDVVESPSGWTSFVADVSGHGVGAGLLMGMLKSTARTQLRTAECLDGLLNTLNTVLVDLKGPTMFATFAGVQDDGTQALRFSVAGHLPILHYHSSTSTISELSIPQVPLAMFSESTFTSAPVTCEQGDLFVILTDGLTEVFDKADDEFGLDRLKSLIQNEASRSLATIEDRVFAAVRAHGGQLDDQTLQLIRATQ
jgi:serine phosphatase RsbU (regulator of sigma subunit)